jgi:hypothetical protein
MRRTKLSMLALVYGLSVYAAYLRESNAHDLTGVVAEIVSLDPDTRAKIERINATLDRLAQQAKNDPTGQLQAVLQSSLKWPHSPVTVCFFSGSQAARDHIATVADRWTSGTSLKFDFGPPGARRSCNPGAPSDIRVSFSGPGYASYVGTTATQIPSDKPTLMLQGMDRATFSADDDGVITHEFGHAIGFQHEHQSPAAGCEEEFNFPWLYSYFVQLGWSKDMVDYNMHRFNISTSASGFLITPFDSLSVMLYSLDSRAFKDVSTAKCYIPHPNDVISPTDRSAVQAVYWLVPPAAAAPGPPLPKETVADLNVLNELREAAGHP